MSVVGQYAGVHYECMCSQYSDSLLARGPGIECRWGVRFCAPILTGSEAHPASYTMGTGSFLGVKWPGCGIDQSPPSSAEVEERV